MLPVSSSPPSTASERSAVHHVRDNCGPMGEKKKHPNKEFNIRRGISDAEIILAHTQHMAPPHAHKTRMTYMCDAHTRHQSTRVNQHTRKRAGQYGGKSEQEKVYIVPSLWEESSCLEYGRSPLTLSTTINNDIFSTSLSECV